MIDVATLKPLDFETILASVEKTGRCVIVHEAALTGGFGAEIAARIAEKGLLSLQAPIERVTGYDTVMPLSATRASLPAERGAHRRGGAARAGVRLTAATRGSNAMKTFNLPDLGEGLQEAEIVSWHVNPGDQVVADQPLVSVETDKAVVEVPSPYSGRIAELFGGEGDIVKVGAPLVAFAEVGAGRQRYRGRRRSRPREERDRGGDRPRERGGGR